MFKVVGIELDFAQKKTLYRIVTIRPQVQ